MEAALENLIAQRRIPGAVVLIGRNGRELCQSVLGMQDVESGALMRRDTIFRLYSMSKPITSAAVLRLAEQHALRLDQPTSEILPEMREMRVYVSGDLEHMRTEPLQRPITIADLLTHTSGITYHFTGETPVHQYYRANGVMRDTPVGRRPTDAPPATDLGTLVTRLGQAPLLHQPGATFSYSYSTTVLGAVIERVCGARLDQALNDLIFTPLGMRDTTFFVEDNMSPRFVTNYVLTQDGINAIETPEASDYRDHARLLDGGGALAGTADDYYRFARMFAEGGEVDGARILSSDSVAEMMAPHVHVTGQGTGGYWFGYGMQIGDDASEAAMLMPHGAVGWGGSGNTFFWADPNRRSVMVFMTQTITPEGFGDLGADLRRIANTAAAGLLSA